VYVVGVENTQDRIQTLKNGCRKTTAVEKRIKNLYTFYENSS